MSAPTPTPGTIRAVAKIIPAAQGAIPSNEEHLNDEAIWIAEADKWFGELVSLRSIVQGAVRTVEENGTADPRGGESGRLQFVGATESLRLAGAALERLANKVHVFAHQNDGEVALLPD